MPRESKANRKTRAAKITRLLKKKYPHAETALRHSDPLELLVATILSAQCTDKRVNIVTKELFKKYKTVGDYAAARQEVFEQEIRTTGFYHNKARNIRAAAEKIVKDFGGKVPDTMAELLTLPGVARKTANCVLGTAFGKNEGVVVDTHVGRLAERLCLTWTGKNSKDALRIEDDLRELFARKDWTYLAHALILHGRRVCLARKPKCAECGLARNCPSTGTFD